MAVVGAYAVLELLGGVTTELLELYYLNYLSPLICLYPVFYNILFYHNNDWDASQNSAQMQNYQNYHGIFVIYSQFFHYIYRISTFNFSLFIKRYLSLNIDP